MKFYQRLKIKNYEVEWRCEINKLRDKRENLLFRNSIEKAETGEALVESLRGFLDRGEFEGGYRLPSVREFQELSGLRHFHVSRALDTLEAEGRIVKRRGAGTFVVGPPTEVETSAKASLKIGVVPPDWDPCFSHHVIALMSKGISEQSGLRHALHLVPGNIAEPQPVEFVRHVSAMGLDGLIWIKPPVAPPVALVRLVDAGMPVVSVGRAYAQLPVKAVLEDLDAMADNLVEFLISKGRRKLICMTGVRNDSYTMAHVNAVRAAMERRGMALPDSQIVTVRLESAAKTFSLDLAPSVLHFLAQQPDFDAVFSMYSDQIGTLAHLHDTNVRRCPEDFIHIHFGQMNVWGGQQWPPFPSAFTTASGTLIGRQAVKELERMLGVESDLTDEDSVPRIIHDPYV